MLVPSHIYDNMSMMAETSCGGCHFCCGCGSSVQTAIAVSCRSCYHVCSTTNSLWCCCYAMLFSSFFSFLFLFLSQKITMIIIYYLFIHLFLISPRPLCRHWISPPCMRRLHRFRIFRRVVISIYILI